MGLVEITLLSVDHAITIVFVSFVRFENAGGPQPQFFGYLNVGHRFPLLVQLRS